MERFFHALDHVSRSIAEFHPQLGFGRHDVAGAGPYRNDPEIPDRLGATGCSQPFSEHVAKLNIANAASLRIDIGVVPA